MKRVRRILLRLLFAVLVAVIVILGVTFGLLRADPSWYQAVVLSEQEQIEGQNRLVDRLATLRNDVGRTQAAVEDRQRTEWPTFEVEFTEAEVNGFLARWMTNPQVRAAFGELEEPHLRFLDDRVELAGRSSSTGALMSIELTVAQSPEGPVITLGRPWAGRLPLSRSLVETPAARGIASLREGDPIRLPVAVIDSAESLATGKPTRPVIALNTSMNSLLETRVEKLTVKDGVLKATLRPTGAPRSADSASK